MGEHAGTVELDQAAVGRISRVDALQQQQMADAQKRRNELRLKQVAVALQGFEDDEYGACKVCGEPIGYRRLKARPESPACVACMSELERG
ncbi:MAG: TraR/DksA C4-type zinc finger protein [Alphaproteobacteria bacterium]|nr:TraR/DksA C4-type zinc finger protein [Alphaproteobacteria bacterium]